MITRLQLLQKTYTTQCPHRMPDIACSLKLISCCLFDLKRTGLRLTVLSHAMCPRFHVDKIPCRLITTYQGIATEWLPHHLVNRTQLGTPTNRDSNNIATLYQDQKDIQQLARGDIALLKGEGWEGNENAGLVHRSPALIPNEKRVLLTLDFLD
jgi:hypothetical protein